MSDKNTDNGLVMEAVSELNNTFGNAMKDIKTQIEDGHKVWHDSMEEQKRATKKKDVLDKEKIERINEDVVKGYESVEVLRKEIGEAKSRADDLELAMKDYGRYSTDGGDVSMECKDAYELEQHLYAGETGKPLKVPFSQFKANINKYNQYKANMDVYMRDHLSQDTKDLVVGRDADGGLTVLPETSNKIITIIKETSRIRSVASVESISSDRIQYRVDKDDNVSSGWVAELSARPKTDTPLFAMREIVVYGQYANAYASSQILDDSSIDIERYLGTQIGDKLSRVENEAFLLGDGIGKPKGMLTYDSGTAWGQVEQINSGSVTGMTYPGYINITTGLKAPYYANASWLFSRKGFAGMLKLADGDSSFAFLDQTLLKGNVRPATMGGYPFEICADIVDPVSTSLSYVFGDLKRAYAIVDRLGVSVLKDVYTQYPNVAFKFLKRTGGDVLNFEAFKIGVCTVIS